MTTSQTAPAILAALIAAQEEIGAVGKHDQNKGPGGGYFFRGVDAVVNASSPAFRTHGIVVTPDVLDHTHEQLEVGSKRTWMEYVTVRVRYTFTSTADGSSVSSTVVGAAGDSGDKATPKAMSVALRTALLQTLMLPTDDPDPDSYTYGQDDPREGRRGGQEQRGGPQGPPAPEPPSPELVRALVALAPSQHGAVAWIKAAADARGLDPNNGEHMARLHADLLQLAGQNVPETVDPATGEVR